MFNRIFQTANTDGSQDTLTACFGITPAILFKSNTVMFQSKNFPTRYISANVINQQVRLEEGMSLVLLRSGIVNGTISIGPVGQPNLVFRHSNFILYTNSVDGSDLQTQDSSFYPVKGLADPKGISFRSYNFPDRYLRHSNFGFYLQPYDSSSLFQDDATFYIQYGHTAGQRFAKTEKVYPEADAKNNRCFGNTSLSDVQAQCMNNPACLGFSFSRTGSVGGGCFKENTLIGTSSNPSYDGYTKQPTIIRDS